MMLSTALPAGSRPRKSARYFGAAAYESYSNLVTYGWTITPNGAQVSLGDNTFLHDISEDGTVIVGASSYALPEQIPTAWIDSGSATALKFLPGATIGWASAVATTEIDIPA